MSSTEHPPPSGTTATSFHMNEADFRRHGKEMIDWVADYLYGGVEQHPVQSRVQPGEIRAQLPGSPPLSGEPFEQIARDLDEIVLPGLTHWQNPNWHGYFLIDMGVYIPYYGIYTIV